MRKSVASVTCDAAGVCALLVLGVCITADGLRHIKAWQPLSGPMDGMGSAVLLKSPLLFPSL
jgi:hypothetical protein